MRIAEGAPRRRGSRLTCAGPGPQHPSIREAVLAAVGLAPKIYCRIQRFTNVFGAIGEPVHNWVETAVACGYYDQAP